MFILIIPNLETNQNMEFAVISKEDQVLTVWLFFRRLNLADIERIAPLEEGSLPYNLVETQKQVGYLQP